MITELAGAGAAALCLATLATGLCLWAEQRWPRGNGSKLALASVAGALALFLGNSTAGAAIAAHLTPDGGDALPWLAAFVAGDLARYGLHRAMHAWPVLWRLHRVHHRQEPVRWWHTWLQHPIDYAAHLAAGLLPFVLLGVSAELWLVAAVARKLWSHLLHADVRWPESHLDRWLITPHSHARHHAANARWDYGNFLSVWDRWLGTRGPRSRVDR